MTTILTTTLHYYYFCIDKAEDKAAYRALCKQLRARGSELFDSISLDHSKWYKETIRPLDGQTIQLETEYIFDNQWNAAPPTAGVNGLRVFDWAEAIYPNKDVKEGMYLDLTPEMVTIRETTYICGCCGKNYPNGAPGFCSACLDSPYLKEDHLHLLRLQPVAIHHHDPRPPLTEAESAALLESYIRAQTTGKESRAVQAYEKEGEEIEREYREAIAKAKAEYKGKKWLHSHRVPMDNCIYYSHTGRFCFGWRSPLSASVAAAFEKRLLHFPYPFDLKIE